MVLTACKRSNSFVWERSVVRSRWGRVKVDVSDTSKWKRSLCETCQCLMDVTV